jgi:hypothetical protein
VGLKLHQQTSNMSKLSSERDPYKVQNIKKRKQETDFWYYEEERKKVQDDLFKVKLNQIEPQRIHFD